MGQTPAHHQILWASRLLPPWTCSAPHAPVGTRNPGSRDSAVGGAAMALASGSGGGGGGRDFSVVVLGSDFAVDAGAALLTSADREEAEWHDCAPDLGDDFSDLEELQVVRVQGADRSGRSVVRVVGKFFPGA